MFFDECFPAALVSCLVMLFAKANTIFLIAYGLILCERPLEQFQCYVHYCQIRVGTYCVVKRHMRKFLNVQFNLKIDSV